MTDFSYVNWEAREYAGEFPNNLVWECPCYFTDADWVSNSNVKERMINALRPVITKTFQDANVAIYKNVYDATVEVEILSRTKVRLYVVPLQKA